MLVFGVQQSDSLCIYILFKLFIYLFIWAFSSFGERGLLSSGGAPASHCGDLSSCEA